MSDGPLLEEALLDDALRRLFDDHVTPEVLAAAEDGVWPERLWRAVAEAGAAWIGVPEHAGGSGGTVAHAALAAFVAGRFAAPIPLVETGPLAGWLLARAGLVVPRAPLSIAPGHDADDMAARRRPGGWELTGTWHGVPWGVECEHIAGLVPVGTEWLVVGVPREATTLTRRRNIAGEPRDTVRVGRLLLVDNAAGIADVDRDALWHRGALLRAHQIAGALERVAELTVRHANERVQFGRPIARFQAVQDHLVGITAQAARTVAVAVGAAARAADTEPATVDAATAKIVASAAVQPVTARAHQVHGAIGTTMEHPLQRLTRRLWSWRDEFGSEIWWSERLADTLPDAGSDGIWRMIHETPAMTVAPD